MERRRPPEEGEEVPGLVPLGVRGGVVAPRTEKRGGGGGVGGEVRPRLQEHPAGLREGGEISSFRGISSFVFP